MRVLVDTNIVLDALLAREPFVEDARALLEATRSQQIQGVCNCNHLNQYLLYCQKADTEPGKS